MPQQQQQQFDLSYMPTQLIDHASDFFGVADPDGKAVFVNSAGREMLGIAPHIDVSQTKST